MKKNKKTSSATEPGPIADESTRRVERDLVCKRLRDTVGEMYEAFWEVEASLEELVAQGWLKGEIREEFECDILRFRRSNDDILYNLFRDR